MRRTMRRTMRVLLLLLSLPFAPPAHAGRSRPGNLYRDYRDGTFLKQ